MTTRALVLCLDGFGPEYLAQSEMPVLRQVAAQGFALTGRSLLPSVTNVNTVALVTGAFPREHGVTGNAYYDPGEGVGGLMEAARFVQAPTIFEQAQAAGWRTALVTAKAKLLGLLGRGADLAVSAERPPATLCAAIGTPAPIYSVEVNYWVLAATRALIRSDGPDLVYAFTTDYAMHKYAPEDARSQEHLRRLDVLLGAILDDAPDLTLFVTADHGMHAKGAAVDLEKWLAGHSIQATVVSTIRDQYTVHHRNLSGSAYVYCAQPGDVPRTADLLRAHPAVEEVWPRAEAAAAFHLLPERIGDLTVLARQDALFGELSETTAEVALRSHGSRYESAVPIIGTTTLGYSPYQYNLDVTRAVQQFFFSS
ncbi:MAG: alkaline phosphatase family protein [Deltaproteobacteria bacterium]|nr:alkaline phosphatase family protein [Deltaproteobacteria bacterium]